MSDSRFRAAGALLFAMSIASSVLIGATSSSATTSYPSVFLGGFNPAAAYVPPSTNGVDNATGAYSQSFTDASIPGRGPVLKLNRTYSSGEYAFQSQSGGTGPGMFGWGWASSYGMQTLAGTGSYTVIQEDGAPVTFVTQSGNQTPPPWAAMTLTVNTNNYTVVRNSQGNRTFVFGKSGALQSISDPDGYTTTVTEATPGLPSSVTDSSGRILTFAYGSNGLVSSITDPLSRVTTYGYDTNDNLISVTQPGGQRTSFTYDASHDLLTITDPDGHVSTNTYGTNGRVVSQTDPLGLTTTFAYSGAPNTSGTTTIVDPHGSETQDAFTYSSSSQFNYSAMMLTAATDGYGTSSPATWTYTYNSNLAPASVTDPNNHTTQTVFNSAGELTSSTDGLNKTTTYGYNSLFEPTVTTDPLGITTTNAYDSKGNLDSTRTVSPGSSSTPSWSNSRTLPSWYASNEALSCTPSFCVAVEDQNQSNSGVVDTTTNPTASSPTWTAAGRIPNWPSSSAQPSISCTTAFCVVVGPRGFVATTDNPAASSPTWTASSNSIPNWSSANNAAVACATNFCIAVDNGGGIAVTTNPSATNPTWSDSSIAIPGFGSVNTPSISCSSAFCLATGDGGVTAFTGDGDVANPTWTAASTLPITSTPITLSCTGMLDCVLFGPGGQTYFSLNAASTSPTWTSITTDSSFNGTSGDAVGCAATFCISTGYTLTENIPHGHGNQYTFTDFVATMSLPTVVSTTTINAYSDPAHSGDVTSTIDPDGNLTTFAYDADGDLASTTSYPSSGVADTTQYVFDVDGERVCEASPSAVAQAISCPANGSRVPGTSTWTYSADGQQTSVTDADGNTITYAFDADGRQTIATDGLGNVSTTSYDADGRVLTTTAGSGTAAATTTSYVYDLAPGSCPSAPAAALWCDQTTDGLGNTTTSYDNPLGQVIEQSPPNATAQTPTTYTYDAAGNFLTTTSGAGTTTNTYDADNRLTAVTYSNTPSGFTQPHGVTYTYDADSNVTQMTDGTGTTTYGYDGLERPIGIKDGAGNTVTYGYDPASNTVCMSYSNSGASTCQNASSGTGIVTYGYNGSNQLVQMTDWLGNVTGFSFDSNGNLTGTSLPTGTHTAIANKYDPTNALTDTSVTTNGTNTDLASLTRNADENIATDSAPAATYTYDALNRVTTGSTATYGYDYDSQLVRITPSGSSTTVQAYNADGQLCWAGVGSATCSSPPAGTTTFGYNAVGDRTSGLGPTGATATYAWNQAGNLVCQTAPNTSGASCSNPNSALTSTYSYNAAGLRMSATPAGGATQQFTWSITSSATDLLEDGTNFYLYGPDVGIAPVEQINKAGSTPTFLVSDTTGVRKQLNSSGSVTGSMTYDTYGNPCSGCSMATPFGFAGSYTDPTGMSYLVNRYYDPTTGQFISVDPDVAETGQAYAYTGGNPVNHTDPLGLRLPVAESCSTTCTAETGSGLGNAGSPPSAPASSSTTSFLTWLSLQSPATVEYFDLLYLASVGYVAPTAPAATATAAPSPGSPAGVSASASGPIYPSNAGPLVNVTESASPGLNKDPRSYQVSRSEMNGTAICQGTAVVGGTLGVAGFGELALDAGALAPGTGGVSLAGLIVGFAGAVISAAVSWFAWNGCTK